MWDCIGVSQLTYFFSYILCLILQGVVKPDITFFGEDLPKRFYFYMRDMLQSDLVIVMGTSLEVWILSCYVSESINFTVRWGKKIPEILINNTYVFVSKQCLYYSWRYNLLLELLTQWNGEFPECYLTCMPWDHSNIRGEPKTSSPQVILSVWNSGSYYFSYISASDTVRGSIFCGCQFLFIFLVKFDVMYM